MFCFVFKSRLFIKHLAVDNSYFFSCQEHDRWETFTELTRQQKNLHTILGATLAFLWGLRKILEKLTDLIQTNNMRPNSFFDFPIPVGNYLFKFIIETLEQGVNFEYI